MSGDQINWGVIDIVTALALIALYWIQSIRIQEKDFQLSRHRFALLCSVGVILFFTFIALDDDRRTLRDDFCLIWMFVGLWVGWRNFFSGRLRPHNLGLLIFGIILFGFSLTTLQFLHTQDHMAEYQSQGFTYTESACLTSPDAYNEPCKHVILDYRKHRS